MRRAVKRVALVEVAEGFENHLQGIRASLPCSAFSEARGAIVTEPALEDFVLLVALAGTGDIGARAVDAALKLGADEWALVVCVGSTRFALTSWGWSSSQVWL